MLWGGGVVKEEKKEKQFYKLVLQLDLLTQYPQTFLPPAKPIKFPNSSSGNTVHLVMFQKKSFMSKCRIIQPALSTVQSFESKGKIHGGQTKKRERKKH